MIACHNCCETFPFTILQLPIFCGIDSFLFPEDIACIFTFAMQEIFRPQKATHDCMFEGTVGGQLLMGWILSFILTCCVVLLEKNEFNWRCQQPKTCFRDSFSSNANTLSPSESNTQFEKRTLFREWFAVNLMNLHFLPFLAKSHKHTAP